MSKRIAGAISIEFVVVLPLIAIALVVLLGLSQALLTKHHAVIAAYGAGLGEVVGVQAEQSRQASFPSEKKWGVSRSAHEDVFISVMRKAGVGELSRWLGDAIGGRDESGSWQYRATVAVDGGLIRRVFSGDEVAARYTLPIGFWESPECCALFSLVSSVVSFGGKSF